MNKEQLQNEEGKVYTIDMNHFTSMHIDEAIKIMRETGIILVDAKDLPEDVQEQLRENRKLAEENIQKEKEKFNRLKEKWEEIKRNKAKAKDQIT